MSKCANSVKRSAATADDAVGAAAAAAADAPPDVNFAAVAGTDVDFGVIETLVNAFAMTATPTS
jgi:hypothetical protein